MASRITPKMTVASVLAQYPDTAAVFRRHGCPDLRRGVFARMYRIMSVRAAARMQRIPLADLMRDLNSVAAGDRGSELRSPTLPPAARSDNSPELAAIMAKEIDQAQAGGNTRAVYRATARLRHNLTVEVNARDFTLLVDEPPGFGGADAGPNPEEVVLAGVGACQVITAALYAAHLGITLRGYEVALRGYADLAGFYGVAAADKPTGFARVVCEVTIDSDASPEQLAAFERLVEARCVGHGTLRAPVAIETSWKLTGTAAAG